MVQALKRSSRRIYLVGKPTSVMEGKTRAGYRNIDIKISSWFVGRRYIYDSSSEKGLGGEKEQ